jgi:hypothetical protein
VAEIDPKTETFPFTPLVGAVEPALPPPPTVTVIAEPVDTA